MLDVKTSDSSVSYITTSTLSMRSSRPIETLLENESADLSTLSPHVLVCALIELGMLVDTLGTSVASTLVSDPSNGSRY